MSAYIPGYINSMDVAGFGSNTINSMYWTKQHSLYDVHQGVQCDGCGANPLRGIRWRCQSCANHNICNECKKLNRPANAGHPLQIVWQTTTNNQNAAASGGQLQPEAGVHWTTCQMCQAYPIRGVLYSCVVCPNVDVCEPCNKQRIANQEHQHRFEFFYSPKASNPPPAAGSSEAALYGGGAQGQQGAPSQQQQQQSSQPPPQEPQPDQWQQQDPTQGQGQEQPYYQSQGQNQYGQPQQPLYGQGGNGYQYGQPQQQGFQPPSDNPFTSFFGTPPPSSQPHQSRLTRFFDSVRAAFEPPPQQQYQQQQQSQQNWGYGQGQQGQQQSYGQQQQSSYSDTYEGNHNNTNNSYGNHSGSNYHYQSSSSNDNSSSYDSGPSYSSNSYSDTY